MVEGTSKARLSRARAKDTSEDTELRKNALFWVGQSGGIDAGELEELRERALFWLGQSKGPRVAEFLLSLIRGRGVNRLFGPCPRGSSGLDLLWRRWPLRLVPAANSPGPRPTSQ